jgi:hypothetical protein
MNARVINLFGDKLKVRRTYDIDSFGMGYYGFDVCNENGEFLCSFIGEDIDELKQFIKMTIYKSFI